MKKPVFFGYGLTTRAIARKLGGGCIFYDDRTTEPRIDRGGNEILPSSMFDPGKSDLEILTPSIRPDNPLLQRARNPVSEYDYFLSPHSSPERQKPFTVWVSGTNGKTTTTQMLTHLLEKRGAVAGGNIGIPIADLDPAAPIWILETSSYTLHHTRTASPDIYLLLPVTPDHLDWHVSARAYEADKLRPLLTMREGQLALVPKGLNLPTTDAWVVEYDSVAFLADFFDIDPRKINFRAAFLEDAMLALSITRTLFDEADYDLVNSFRMDEHRQQELRDKHGRLWVNDSKATNVDATLKALDAYSDRHIHLILGGDDKGVDLSGLMDRISELDVTLYAVGSNQHKLLSMAQTRSVPTQLCHRVEQAVDAISPQLQTGQVALLSPAASSLDQYSSYAQRGALFMESIKSLN
jgi:UDP-N-acetylmuramoylalanine--D-glutamate ligase